MQKSLVGGVTFHPEQRTHILNRGFLALRYLDLPQQPLSHLHVLHYLGFLQRTSLQMNIYASTTPEKLSACISFVVLCSR